MERDRDEHGRPRNARPRDETGRPLGRDAAGVPPVSEDAGATPAETLAAAQHALDESRPFAAHEILEGAWRSAAADERAFWQGLAQVAVGLTHLQRGNTVGAVSLLRRGAQRLAPYAGTTRHGVDVDDVQAVVAELAVAIERNDPVVPNRVRLLPVD